MDISREKAWKVLTSHVQEPVLLNHCKAVEAAMRGYGEKFGGDADYWAAVGLLHDVDFERYPDEHPNHAAELLQPHGYSAEFIRDVESHARDWSAERTQLQKTLYAVDELTGFIIACALVRPDKEIRNVETKSVLKKLKDKAFARAVNRDTLYEGAEMLGIEMSEHIAFVRDALADNMK